MKMFAFSALAILVSASAFALNPPHRLQVVRTLGDRLPNIVCEYESSANGWHFASVVAAVVEVNGKFVIGNAYIANVEPQIPGHAVCTERDKDMNGNVIAFKMFSYSFTQKFLVQPGTCNVSTNGAYEITEKVKARPLPGLISEIEMDQNDGTQLKIINYYVTAAELQAWSKDLKLIKEKCRALFPEAQ